MALYGAETWTLRKVDQKHLVSLEMWGWRRMGKISWTDHVRNEEVLQRGEEYHTNIRKKEGKLDWSHLVQELSSRTRY